MHFPKCHTILSSKNTFSAAKRSALFHLLVANFVFLPFGAGHVAYFYLSATAANEVDENGGESEPKQ